VIRIAEATIPLTKFGAPRILCYRVSYDSQEPMAIVWGDFSKVEAPLVRMHSSCFISNVLDSLRSDSESQLRSAMKMIHHAGAGAIVYLPQPGQNVDLLSQVKSFDPQVESGSANDANLQPGSQADVRDYMVGLQILKDLGLRQVRLLTNHPKKSEAFVYSAFDLKLIEQVPIVAPSDAD
jgi:3,4-dihydroxy 2-butanone 4-phosphate synthase/GTP cyclohydrolase II